MGEDAKLSNLLKWSIENSNPSNPANPANPDDKSPHQDQSETDSQPKVSRGLDAATLNALLGGPSDADLMRESMAAILNTTVPISEKLIAFDNFEQLIESLDNANNLASLGLWTPLLAQLENSEAEIRKMAAWCVGTAVQNNAQSQERALVGGAVPKLVKMLKTEEDAPSRRKARYAVSSLVRNYQPGMDALLEALGDGREKVDASDMEKCDELLEELVKRE